MNSADINRVKSNRNLRYALVRCLDSDAVNKNPMEVVKLLKRMNLLFVDGDIMPYLRSINNIEYISAIGDSALKLIFSKANGNNVDLTIKNHINLIDCDSDIIHPNSGDYVVCDFGKNNNGAYLNITEMVETLGVHITLKVIVIILSTYEQP